MQKQSQSKQSQYLKGKNPQQIRTYQIDLLFSLKQLAIQHLKDKKYADSIIYFQDILNKVNELLNKTIKVNKNQQQQQQEPFINSQELMQKVVLKIKIPTHKNLTLCYLKQQQYDKCIKQCQQVLNVEPNNTKIIFRCGEALLKCGNLNQAQKILRKGYMLDPNQKQFMKALQEVQNKRKIIKKNFKLDNLEKKSALERLLNCILMPFLILMGLFAMIKQKVFSRKPKDD